MTDSEKLDFILSKITNFDEKITSLDGKVTSLDEKVTSLDEKVSSLDERLVKIENDVTDIKMTFENELRVNIQRVAEGHLDLSRKLNECIKLSSDIKAKQEIQDIYFNMYNNKLKVL